MRVQHADKSPVTPVAEMWTTRRARQRDHLDETTRWRGATPLPAPAHAPNALEGGGGSFETLNLLSREGTSSLDTQH